MKKPIKGSWEYTETLFAWVTGVVTFLLFSGEGISVGSFLLSFLAGHGIGAIVHQFAYRSRVRQFDLQPCIHGVPGGQLKNLCGRCQATKKAEEERLIRQKAQAERLKVLTQDAAKLRDKECLRLKKTLSLGIDELLTLTPFQFEDRIAELYCALGYVVHQTPYTGDKGRDAIAYKDGNTYLIECKLYRPDRSVGRRDLQVFYAAIIEAKAKLGFLVTTGRLTAPAIEWIKDKPMTLVDSKHLIGLMQDAYPEGNKDEYKVLCQKCGATVNFHLLSKKDLHKSCLCGDTISPSLTLNDLFPQKIKKKSERSRPSRRRYRRHRY